MPDPTNAEEWRRLARDELGTAEDLLQMRRWKQAFYHAGLAVECALKCRIMLVHRLNQWPERGAYHTHSLARLAQLADVDAQLLAEIEEATEIGLCWMVVKDWSIGTRYDAQPFPLRRAKDMVEATGKRGLIRWLMTP